MAGDWIKMRTNLDTDVRVIELAGMLNMTELHVVGCLWKLWAWADQHTQDGNAMRVTSVTLDRFTGVTGFAEALRKVDWLAGRDGALTFPRFVEHNGQTAKNRAKTKERVAKHRNASIVTDVTQKQLPEKRREEKSIPPNPQGKNADGVEDLKIPEKLKTNRFQNALNSWFEVIRREKGRVNAPAIQVDLLKLSEFSERKAVGFVLAWAAGNRFTSSWKADWETYQPSDEPPKAIQPVKYKPQPPFRNPAEVNL